MIIIFTLEGLCVFPLLIMWIQTDKGKIEEDTALNIGIGYAIITSIINWICYAAKISGLKLFIAQGLYESIIDLDAVFAAIVIPVLTLIISYVIFILIIVSK
jgi:hypothetical protein